MSEQSSPEFEREKWHAEHELRNREHKLRTRWLTTIVVAVGAAVVTAIGNIVLEASKAAETRLLEEDKAEATRILEMIKTGNAEKAANNLKFLVDAGLISNDRRRARIKTFLDARGTRSRTRTASCRYS